MDVIKEVESSKYVNEDDYENHSKSFDEEKSYESPGRSENIGVIKEEHSEEIKIENGALPQSYDLENQAANDWLPLNRRKAFSKSRFNTLTEKNGKSDDKVELADKAKKMLNKSDFEESLLLNELDKTKAEDNFKQPFQDKKSNIKYSTATMLLKTIAKKYGGNLPSDIKSIVARKSVERQEYDIKFHFLRCVKIFFYCMGWF